MIGDFNRRVSEIIALIINPAIFLGILILLLLYNSYKIVLVLPTGFVIIVIGSLV